ncbi:MAG: hypothetical protein ACI4EX_04195 [Lachnospiraceae bacterium]
MIAFLNALLSYLVVLVAFVCVIGVGITVGISMRKKKNAEEKASAESKN